MIRSVFAVITGFVVWLVVATLGDFLIRAMLTGYAAAEPSMAFTLTMLLARLTLGLVSSVVAGFACSAMARGKVGASYVFAIALVLCFLPMHYNVWSKFPPWYHLTFLVTLAPLVLLGAIAQRRRAASAPRGASAASR
jgi:hypothetical protein